MILVMARVRFREEVVKKGNITSVPTLNKKGKGKQIKPQMVVSGCAIMKHGKNNISTSDTTPCDTCFLSFCNDKC